MSAQEIWLTHYHLSSIDSKNVIYTGYVLAWAENQEDYRQKVADFCENKGVKAYAQLAPLPILIWFKRHGFSASLLNLAKTLSAQNPVAIWQDGELENELITPNQDYLSQTITQFEPFTNVFSREALPKLLKEGFFAEFNGLDEWHKLVDLSYATSTKIHYYAVVDCAKVIGFPERLEYVGRIANLYTGVVGETLERSAPYLLEFDASQLACVELLQTLFRQMDSEILSHWKANPMVFIRSHKKFESVYHHLRKFTHLRDPETGKWYFFRFYDPMVLADYLPQLNHHPAHLAAFFGVKGDEMIIESYGVRIEKQFFNFTPNNLPKDILPARIEFGKIKHNAINIMNIEKFKRKLTALYIESHPNRFRTLKDEHIATFIEHVYQSSLQYKITNPKEISYFGHIMLYLGAYWYDDPIYHFLNKHLQDDTHIADRRIADIADKFAKIIPEIFGGEFENNITMAKEIFDWYQFQTKDNLSPTSVMHYFVKVAHPYFNKCVSQKVYLEHISQSLQCASEKFGVKTDYEQAIWLILSLTLGIGFYQDPLIPWVADILNSQKDISEKINELSKMLRKRANKMFIAAGLSTGERYV